MGSEQVQKRVKEILQTLRNANQPRVTKEALLIHLNALDALVKDVNNSKSAQKRGNIKVKVCENGKPLKRKVAKLREQNKLSRHHPNVSVDSALSKNITTRVTLGRLKTLQKHEVEEMGLAIIPSTDQRVKNHAIIDDSENCLTTRTPYLVTISTSQFFNEEEADETKSNLIEVPTYREINLTNGERESETSYDDNGDEEVEDLRDESFLKRHQKLEIDERRRKRWDSQRLREESYLDRLKRNRTSTRKEYYMKRRRRDCNSILDCVGTLLPSPEDACFIRVDDDIVISAFGHPVPVMEKAPFRLPWKTEKMSGLDSYALKLKKESRNSCSDGCSGNVRNGDTS